MPHKLLPVMFLTLAAAASIAPAAVRIQHVLPFTPSEDSVHILTSVSGAIGVKLSAKITPWRKSDVIWSGPIEAGQIVEHLHVQPWSPGSPNLYELAVTATLDGKPVDSKAVRFGFR